MDCIRKTMIHEVFSENVRWHIIGSGHYEWELKTLSDKYIGKVILYGQRPRDFIVSHMPKMDLSIIPSIFIETFGLVALEALMQNVPVCGFKKWWLSPFIEDSLAIDENDPSNSLLQILDHIMKYGFPKKPSLDLYSITLWREELKLVVWDAKKILIINDYLAKVWWAEIYIALLKEELLALGKEIRIIGYYGSAQKWKRILLWAISPISFWHKRWIEKEIQEFNPDIIWMHNVERFIWPWGVLATTKSWKKTIITHHDLGLVTARPSRITHENQIPKKLSFKEFLEWSNSPIESLARIGKYVTLIFFWKHLKYIDLHLVPSDFMRESFEKFWAKQVEVFPHSIR